MFARIVQASLRSRAAVLLFTMVVVVAGIVAFRGLTIEAFPDPTDTQVQVITPDEASVGAFGPNPLDPEVRAPCAHAGYEQGKLTELAFDMA